MSCIRHFEARLILSEVFPAEDPVAWPDQRVDWALHNLARWFSYRFAPYMMQYAAEMVRDNAKSSD